MLLGLSRADLCNIKGFNNELKENLAELCKEREQIIKEFKSSILIHFDAFKTYGDSEHVQNLTKLLKDLENEGEKKYLSSSDIVDIREYLMLTLAYINCLRCSNLMNITLKDFNKAKRDKDIKDSYTFTNKKHRVSIIYGSKLVLAPTTLYNQLKLYVKFVRTKIIKDSYRGSQDRYLFVTIPKDEERPSWKPMSHSSVTSCLTRSFDKASVFSDSCYFKSVSCSRISFSVITELVCLGTENLDNIAYSFAKHSKEVCKRFYVQYFSNREAARLSWKCYSLPKPLTQEEQKAVKEREDPLKKKSIPTFKDLQKFYDMKNQIKISSHLDVTDDGLEKLLKMFREEMKTRVDGRIIF